MSLVSDRYSGNLALLLESGRTIDYSELREELFQFQKAFPDGKGGIVFCLCNNDLPSLLCYLAAMDCGVVPLLLPGTIQDRQLQALMAAYLPKYLFHNRDDLKALGLGRRTLCVDDYEMLECRQTTQYELNPSLALLLATSGSTGSPKLVRLSAANLTSNASAIAEYLTIGPQERAITSLPMQYSYGLSVINSHLKAGASIVLTNRSLLDAEYWRLISRHDVTSFAGVPYSYEMLLKLNIERLKMPTVRTVTQAGGKLAPERVELVHKACNGRGIRFFVMYGQTEATARIAYLPPEDVLRKVGSVGVPIPGGRLWLEDEGARTISEPGVRGRLVYAGPNVSLGYARSYRDLALGDVNCGVLTTGDLASVDEDGYFYIQGRVSRFIKIFGVRVSLDAVERTLQDCGVHCAVLGEDDRLLICLVGEVRAEPEDVRKQIAEMLSVNKAGVAVRRVDVLPRLSSGKVDYRKLAET